MRYDPGVYCLLQFLSPPAAAGGSYAHGGLHPMQGCLTKLRILFHCLLDGGQSILSQRRSRLLSENDFRFLEVINNEHQEGALNECPPDLYLSASAFAHIIKMKSY